MKLQLQCPCPRYICPRGACRGNDGKGYLCRSDGFKRTPAIASVSVCVSHRSAVTRLFVEADLGRDNRMAKE